MSDRNNREMLDLYECGHGWHKIISPVIDLIDKTKGRVDQVKEKYGALRIYWSPPLEGCSDEDYDRVEQAIDNATDESRRTCEMCGAPGALFVKSRWYQTLCDDHAEKLGYTTRA